MALQLDDGGSEDVSDFLERIREMGDRKDREDEERNRKLEQDIIQGRLDRQARRAERARSLSPTKNSPATTTQSLTIGDPDYKHKIDSIKLSSPQSSKVSGLTSTHSSSSPPQAAAKMDKDEHSDASRQMNLGKAGISVENISPKRSPMAWQQRSKQSSFDITPKSPTKPTIHDASDARPSSSSSSSPTQAQIAQMLSSKDPTWFRQTADQGKGSLAFLRPQDEQQQPAISAERTLLPGLARDTSSAIAEMGYRNRSPSPSTKSSLRGSAGWMPSHSASSSRSGSVALENKSAMPSSLSQRFELPKVDQERLSRSNSTSADRPLAMSPSQGRLSPERRERSASPTKGLGGFVQSAMMKRSDSVAKRLGNTPQSLSRSGSVVGHYTRTSVSSIERKSASATPQQTPSPEFSEHATPKTEQASQNSSMKTSENSRQTSAPAVKAEDSRSGLGIRSVKELESDEASSKLDTKSESSDCKAPTKVTPPLSPTKPADTRRWSPGKSSWLESALKKEVEPPKFKPSASDKPAWMAELSKAKAQRANADLEAKGVTSENSHSSSLSSLSKTESKKADESIASTPIKPTLSDESKGERESFEAVTSTKKSPPIASKPFALLAGQKSTEEVSSSEPKTDFRSSLRSRPTAADQGGAAEPEFKAVFGNLKRTKTQNYVAPDELKNNILRGKAGLAVTGGPKKTERVDEFKESILKRKEAMKAKGVGQPKATESTAPEVNSSKARSPPLPHKPASMSSPEFVKFKGVLHSTPKTEEKEEPAAVSKLASKLNPGLAGILARGRPLATGNSTVSDTKPVEESRELPSSAIQEASGPQLTHATKSRARGPKRRPPKTSEPSISAEDKPIASTLAPVEKEDFAKENVSFKPAVSKIGKSPAPLPSKSPKPEPKPFPISPRKAFGTGFSSNDSKQENQSPKTSSFTSSPKPKTQSVIESASVSSSRDVSEPKFPRKLPEKPAPVRSPATKTNGGLASIDAPSKESAASPKVTIQSSPPLSSFFTASETDKLDHRFDVASYLEARSPTEPKLKTVTRQIWATDGDGKKEAAPSPEQEHILFDEKIYICTHTLHNPATSKNIYETYLWVGHAVSPASMEDARLFARKAARENSGSKLELLHQGRESANFIQALGGILVTRRGRTFTQKPFMLCGRKYVDQMVFDEVPLLVSNLSSGFPYIVVSERIVYLWKSRGSSAEELGCARLIAMDAGTSPDIEEVQEGSEPKVFLAVFGDPESVKIRPSADHWRHKPRHPQYATRLFHFAEEQAGRNCITVSEIIPFAQPSLSATEIYLLDAFFELYIIVGPRAQSRLPSFRAALDFAQEYAILAVSADDRPSVPVCTVVLEGAPRDLKVCFRRWDEDLDAGLKVGKMGGGIANKGGLRVVSLSSALESLRA